MNELACTDCVRSLVKEGEPMRKDYPNMTHSTRMYALAWTVMGGDALCEDHALERLGVEQ